MKVVLFCGGRGIRLREHSETVPKPMVAIGYRPILWHVMRYYAHYGHREFILCLGYKADVIKRYFLDYEEALSNDFVLNGSDRKVELLGRDMDDWEISFVDTGLNATLAERLCAIRPHLGGDDVFLANYADVLTDAPLNDLVDDFANGDAIAAFLSIRPTNYSFHIVRMRDERRVAAVEDVTSADLWINGGYFILRREFLDQLRPGEDLVEEPLRRLLPSGKVLAQRHEGFWAPMDTLKDQQWLETLHERGDAPWQVWDPDRDVQPQLEYAAAG
jgi:glucose-1-phosphate cytidylyltransferase